MKSFIQNKISFLRKRVETSQQIANKCSCDAIVSAYSYLPDTNWLKSSSNSCDQHLAGILYADVAEYARLTEEDEEGAHRRLVEGLRIMKVTIAETQGKIAHFAGDAVLAEFKNADSALLCAINVQLAVRHWNANINPTKQVRFRIGINFGEVIADQGDIYGKAVNLAARLEGLAHSNGICVSQSARENLRRKSKIRFISLGKRYLKNINEPVEAFWIQIDGKELIDLGQPSATRLSAVVS